jgi:hypothetical protein
VVRVKILLALAGLSLASAAAFAQKATPADAEKVAWDSIVCPNLPGAACRKLVGQGLLFATPGANSVVMAPARN